MEILKHGKYWNNSMPPGTSSAEAFGRVYEEKFKVYN
jgi:hypothetical protein